VFCQCCMRCSSSLTASSIGEATREESQRHDASCWSGSHSCTGGCAHSRVRRSRTRKPISLKPSQPSTIAVCLRPQAHHTHHTHNPHTRTQPTRTNKHSSSLISNRLLLFPMPFLFQMPSFAGTFQLDCWNASQTTPLSGCIGGMQI
jgi:hypothetical protein